MTRGCTASLVVILLMVVFGSCDIGTDDRDGWPDLTVYNLGDQGPAGGIAFYDKGERSDGWRYLESSLVDQGVVEWGPNPSFVGATERRVGSGRSNTDSFIEVLGTGTGYAAEICVSYESNGFADWFLPSLDELIWLYERRGLTGLVGSFAAAQYWSSTELTLATAYYINFSNALMADEGKNGFTYNVRAIRRF